jgi:hypothetical protein
MTSSDKTKSQLIDSMRMSKGGASEAPARGDAGKSTAVKKKTSKAKRAPVKAAAKKPAAKKAAVAAERGRASIARDSYQSGMRIWPD